MVLPPDKINFKSGHSGSGDPVEATTYESDEISLYIVAGETFGGKQIYTDTPSSLTSSSKLYTLDEASRATNITSNFELPTA